MVADRFPMFKLPWLPLAAPEYPNSPEGMNGTVSVVGAEGLGQGHVREKGDPGRITCTAEQPAPARTQKERLQLRGAHLIRAWVDGAERVIGGGGRDRTADLRVMNPSL